MLDNENTVSMSQSGPIELLHHPERTTEPTLLGEEPNGTETKSKLQSTDQNLISGLNINRSKKQLKLAEYKWQAKIKNRKTRPLKLTPAATRILERNFRVKKTNKQEVQTVNEEKQLFSGLTTERKLYVYGKSVQIPTTWNPFQSSVCELYSISQDCPEFQNILATMKATNPSVKIESIHRVQNLFLYQKMYAVKQSISSYCSDVNEKLLFHGTRNTNPRDIIIQGFDVRLAGSQNLWGPGIYFAEDFNYVDAYAFRKTATTKILLVSSVVLGDSFDFGTSPCPTLKKPPINISRKRMYDSISGTTQGAKVHTIYNSDQCCPSYIIHYSLEKL